ncbi:MAG: SCO family protein [Deltaproteobacteria bacterium]|nr:SCO family protein [Deltaproteobacteria bacterium]
MKKRHVLRLLMLLLMIGLTVEGVYLLKHYQLIKGERALPILGEVADFSFPTAEGKILTRHDLGGKVWIADLIFTSCHSQCVIMSRQMERLQKSLADRQNVDFVSITVDPAKDTPEVLSQYARRFNALSGRWHFLSGRKEEIYSFAQKSLRLGVAPNEKIALGEDAILHSSKLVLIDHHFRIRGYYDGTEDKAMKRLLSDVRNLIQADGGWR